MTPHPSPDDEPTAETVAPELVTTRAPSSRPPPPIGGIGAGAVDRVRSVLVRGRLTVARIMVRFMLAATLAATPVVLFAPGEMAARVVGTIALAVLVAVFGTVIFRARRGLITAAEPFAGPVGMLIGVTAGVALNWAFGLFAPLPFAGLMGVIIIFLGVGSSEAEARALYVASAIVYTVAIGLSLLGVLPQMGLLDEGAVSQRTMLITLAGNDIGR